MAKWIAKWMCEYVAECYSKAFSPTFGRQGLKQVFIFMYIHILYINVRIWQKCWPGTFFRALVQLVYVLDTVTPTHTHTHTYSHALASVLLTRDSFVWPHAFCLCSEFKISLHTSVECENTRTFFWHMKIFCKSRKTFAHNFFHSNGFKYVCLICLNILDEIFYYSLACEKGKREKQLQKIKMPQGSITHTHTLESLVFIFDDAALQLAVQLNCVPAFKVLFITLLWVL